MRMTAHHHAEAKPMLSLGVVHFDPRRQMTKVRYSSGVTALSLPLGSPIDPGFC